MGRRYVFANYISHKQVVFWIYEELSKLISKKPNIKLENEKTTWKDHFAKKDIQMVHLYVGKWNDVQHHWPFSSVQFSRSVVSDSLRPHESQHARPSCPSPTPRVHSNSCPLSQWCHPTLSSSVILFSSWVNLFQHQCLFQWVSSSNQVAKVLELQLQHQYFQWIFRTDFL